MLEGILVVFYHNCANIEMIIIQYSFQTNFLKILKINEANPIYGNVLIIPVDLFSHERSYNIKYLFQK